MIPWIIFGSDMRATPPAARMSAGTRSRAMTATAPASSAIRACSGVTTSMITPPLSIWARPFLVAQVEVSTVIRARILRVGARPAVLADQRRGAIGPSGRLSHGIPPLPGGPPGLRLRADSVTASAPEGLQHPREQADGALRGGRREPAHRVDECDQVVVVERLEEREQPEDGVVRDLRQ